MDGHTNHSSTVELRNSLNQTHSLQLLITVLSNACLYNIYNYHIHEQKPKQEYVLFFKTVQAKVLKLLSLILR